jgi:hypothetical protein
MNLKPLACFLVFSSTMAMLAATVFETLGDATLDVDAIIHQRGSKPLVALRAAD